MRMLDVLGHLQVLIERDGFKETLRDAPKAFLAYVRNLIQIKNELAEVLEAVQGLVPIEMKSLNARINEALRKAGNG